MENNPRFQRNLFSGVDGSECLPVVAQADIINVLTPHFLYLWHSVMGPWGEFLNYRATDKNFQDYTEEETAQHLTTQATHRARQYLDGCAAVRLVTRHRKLVIFVEEKLAVTIKKITKRSRKRGEPERFTHSNYRTRANVNYWRQRRTEPAFDVPRVILGYQLLKEITEIKLFIAYPRSRHRGMEWVWPMPAQPPIAMPLTPVIAAEGQESEKGFVIEPAQTAKRVGDPTGKPDDVG